MALRLKVAISFHRKDLPEEIAAELPYPGYEYVTDFRGTSVHGGSSEGELFVIVNESLVLPEWLKDVPKQFRLISFEGEAPFESLSYNIEASPTEEGASIGLTLRAPITSEVAFRKSIEMLEAFLEEELSSEKEEVQPQVVKGEVSAMTLTTEEFQKANDLAHRILEAYDAAKDVRQDGMLHLADRSADFRDSRREAGDIGYQHLSELTTTELIPAIRELVPDYPNPFNPDEFKSGPEGPDDIPF